MCVFGVPYRRGLKRLELGIGLSESLQEFENEKFESILSWHIFNT